MQEEFVNIGSYALVFFAASALLTAQQDPAPKPAAKRASGCNCGMMSGGGMNMKNMDATLQQKLAAMNAASGETKVDAMAAVINELVSQRARMQNMMMAGGGQGMGGMQGMHGGMQQKGGGMREMGGGVQNCPCKSPTAGADSTEAK